MREPGAPRTLSRERQNEKIRDRPTRPPVPGHIMVGPGWLGPNPARLDGLMHFSSSNGSPGTAAGQEPERTDGQLLAAFLATRDELAFEEIVRRHGPLVFGVCRRLLHNE